MAIKRVNVIVHGNVQGVYFRNYTQSEASGLDLSGWVRNRNDGTVETVLEGEEDKVDKMIEWLHTGSPMSEVTSVDVTEEKPVGEIGAFNIRFH